MPHDVCEWVCIKWYRQIADSLPVFVAHYWLPAHSLNPDEWFHLETLHYPPHFLNPFALRLRLHPLVVAETGFHLRDRHLVGIYSYIEHWLAPVNYNGPRNLDDPARIAYV